jgi:hypothetical protein
MFEYYTEKTTVYKDKEVEESREVKNLIQDLSISEKNYIELCILTEIAVSLLKYRESYNMTEKELAAKLGSKFTEEHVEMIENCDLAIDIDDLAIIISKLNLSCEFSLS